MKQEQYEAMMDDVYRFVMVASDNYSTPRDYGTGKVLNMVEMHTLSMIADQPGVCVTDVAKMWNRTLGAASKNVNRLCDKGYVEKKKYPGNDKTIHLHPTELGENIARLHKQYDRENIAKILKYLTEVHTEEELMSFYRVLLTCTKLYEERRKNEKTADAE